MSLLEGGDVEYELTATRRENLGSVLIDSTTMAEGRVSSFEQIPAASVGGAARNRGQVQQRQAESQSLPLSPPGPGLPSRRNSDDPVPICPDCRGLLRRIPVEGSVVKTWGCDVHGLGVIPEWAPPIRDREDGHFPYDQTEEQE